MSDPTLPDLPDLPDTVEAPDTETSAGEPSTGPYHRRPLDVTSLVAGIVVLAVVAVFAFGDPDSLREQGRVVGPLVLLGIGAALLLGSLRR